MSTSMVNSKEFLFFGLLLFVFLSFQVLAHDEENNANHLSVGGPSDDDDPRDHSIGYEYNAQSSTHNPSKFRIMDCDGLIDDKNPKVGYKYNSQSSNNNPSKLGRIDKNWNYHCRYYHKNGPSDDEDPRDQKAQSFQQNPSKFRSNRARKP
uniref:LlDD4A9 n=1 Tax=Lupinus luteus TaxID=3873 RepID=Q9XFC3_LUPLU|nr:LlDD4A9 [Lupinus luteus]